VTPLDGPIAQTQASICAVAAAGAFVGTRYDTYPVPPGSGWIPAFTVMPA
jgi:hypothetical protein